MRFVHSIAIAALAATACAGTPGWEDCGGRRWPSPVKVLWRANLSAGENAFSVERREGAEGSVDFVRSGTGCVLRIEKTNSEGYILVKARKPYAAKIGVALRARALVDACSEDTEHALGYLRMYGRKENLARNADIDGARGSGGMKMAFLVNTPPGSPERKLAHFRPTDKTGGEVTPAIVVAGTASSTVWSEWTIEEQAAAVSAWRSEVAARTPPDRAADRIPEDVFEKGLAADRDHTARVERMGGFSRLLVDGEEVPPIIFKGQHGKRGGKNTFAGRTMQDAGVTLQSCSIRLGVAPSRLGCWSKDGLDAQVAVREVRDAMRSSDRSLFVLSVAIDAYPEFTQEHPDEAWRLADGRPVVGHHVHAALPAPAETPKGCWVWASNHSLVWRDAVKRNLAEIVSALKDAGLAKRIVGFHLAGYHDGQFATRHPDYSAPAVAAFRRRLRARYGTAAALSAAWGREIASFDAVTPPAFDGKEDFIDPAKERDKFDFLDFLKRGPFEMQEDVVRHVKRLFGKDVIAVRWCMSPFGGTYNSAYDVTPFAMSDVFDVIVAQPSYMRRAPGIANAVRMPLESFHIHGKLYLNEFDYQTYGALGPGDTDPGVVTWSYAWDFPMWATIHRKGAGQMFAHRMGFWYFDMNGGWFEPREIAADIASTVQAGRSLLSAVDGWHPSAALVLDEDGMLLRNAPNRYYRHDEKYAVNEQMHLLASSGVPYDMLLANDLIADPSLGRRYRTLVFAGMYRIDRPRLDMLKALQGDGRALVFLSNCGRLGGCEEGTSFRLKVHPAPRGHAVRGADRPDVGAVGLIDANNRAYSLGQNGYRPDLLTIDEDAEMEVAARYADGCEPAVAIRRRRGWTSIYVCEPAGLTAGLFNETVRESGGYAAFDRAGVQVDMNGSFVSLHCIVPGRYGFRPPRRCAVVNMKSNTAEMYDGGVVPLELSAGETCWLKLVESAPRHTVDAFEDVVVACDRAADEEWRAVADRSAFDSKCARFKERFRKTVGYCGIQRTPLNAKPMGCKDYGAFRIEKVMMESAPGEFVPLLVFLPDARKFAPPYAGFVFIPGHSNSGKGHADYMYTCELGARNGLASAIYDPLGQGERSQGAGLLSADEHVRIGAYAALLGETTATYMLRDAVRVLDYFENRPDVDPSRIGACGNSGGGTISSFLMVIDDRVKAATPSCYLSSARKHLIECGPQDAEQMFFDSTSLGFNHAALVLSAGCPVLINAAVEDVFPIEGSRSTYGVVRDVATKVGLPDGWYALSEAPGKHRMSKVHREQAIRFLLKHLKDENVGVAETETTAFSTADVNVTPDGEVSRLAGFRSIYDEMADKFVARGVSAEQAARNARPLVVKELAGPDCKGVLATMKGGVEKGRRAVLMIGAAASPDCVTVTLFADGPRYVAKRWRKGKLGYYDRRADDEIVAVDLYLAGRSLVALRAAELLAIAAELKRRTGLAPELVAEGRFATAAKFASAADASAFSSVRFQNEPKPFLESLKARDYLSFADSGAICSACAAGSGLD